MITIDEIRAAYEEACEKSGVPLDGYFSFRELMDLWKASKTMVAKYLHLAKHLGALEVGRKQSMTLIGVSTLVPCYRITLKPGKKGKHK